MAADEKGSTDVSELSRKRLLTRFNRKPIGRAWIKQGWIRLAWIKDDSGVAALIIAAVIAVIAFTALSIFLNKFIGGRELARAQSGASGQARVLPAIFGYYLADVGTPAIPGSTAPHKLPCPDTALTPTGHATGTCAAAGTNYIGVVPWADLGLSRSDVTDSYGRFYTYIVSGDASGVCESITKDAVAGGGQEFTGRLLTPRLEALLASQSAGQGRKVPFVLIGHGANGTGALSNGGSFTSTPTSTFEQGNETSSNGTSYRALVPASGASTAIYTGPVSLDNSSPSTYFDDQVLVPGTTDVEKVCGQVTPGGGINASLADSFASAAATAANFGNVSSAGVGTNLVTVQASASDSTNKVAAFAVTAAGAATAYLVTNSSNFDFDPLTRAVYTKATWRAGAAGATFSIATRASESDLTAGSDLFTTNGITFRFGATLQICNNNCVAANQLATGAGLTISSGTLYTLEVYDNGSDVWMRIYPTASPGTSATISATYAGDTGGSQQVFFINPSTTATAEVDDITVGFPMLAAETSGAITSYITSTGNGTSTGSLTLEAWVRPRALTDAAIIAKWDTAATTTSSFRLRVNSSGNVYLDATTSGGSGTTVEHFKGPDLTVNTWAHIAVTYTFNNATGTANDTETVAFFKNGDQITSATSTSTDPAGIVAGVPNFYVGADLNGAAVADPFNGDIADVRVWSAARTADQIHTYFQSRLSADNTDTSIDNLVVNWRLDSESLDATNGLAFTNDTNLGTNAATTPATRGTAGAVHGATTTLVPTLALYFRPVATSFCPGAVAGAYECDFRIVTTSGAAGTVSSLAVPSNLLSVYAKVWGAGGGGYYDSSNQSAGGSGGFSEGKLTSINTVPLYQINGTASLKIYVGGYGTGSTSVNLASGGGAGSGIFDSSNHVGIIAGGGGGASFSNADPTTGADCGAGTVNRTVTQCGLGGNGGGLTATMADAFDAVSQCGGRAGDNVSSGSGPPTSGAGTGDCDDGGGDPTLGGNLTSTGNGGAAGASGGAGGSDGLSSSHLLAGGSGADANESNHVNMKTTDSNAPGGGGGGGGAVGGEAGGYDHATAHAGYGGGGGSAAKDSSGLANANGAVGSYTLVPGSSFNDTATGNVFSINKALTTITGISKNVTAAGWTAGMSISGTGIKPGATIFLIVSTTSVIVTQGSGNGTHNGVNLSVSSSTASSLISAAGGSSDFYYSPSFVDLSTYSLPGTGGTTSSSINGAAGAVVLIW